MWCMKKFIYECGTCIYSPTDPRPWIQIDFLETKTLSGVISKGHPSKDEWVTSYQVFTSNDGKSFMPYSDIINGTTPKTFTGNTDNTTEIQRLFNRNIYGRFIRIYPLTWHKAASMVFEIVGCNPSEAMNMTTVVPINASGSTPTAKPNNQTTETPTAKTSPVTTETTLTTTPKFGETYPVPIPNFTRPPTGTVHW